MLSVGDADNFRLYHTPGFGWRWPLKFRSVPETVKGCPVLHVVTHLLSTLSYYRIEGPNHTYTHGWH